VLVGIHQRAGADTRLRVVAAGAATGRPLQLTGLDQQFPVFATLEQALAAN
jgi:anti-anti-sigma regulatory factor